jgi:hypothetical protein
MASRRPFVSLNLIVCGSNGRGMTQIKPKRRSFAYRADALNLDAASGHDRRLTDDGGSPYASDKVKPAAMNLISL